MTSSSTWPRSSQPHDVSGGKVSPSSAAPRLLPTVLKLSVSIDAQQDFLWQLRNKLTGESKTNVYISPYVLGNIGDGELYLRSDEEFYEFMGQHSEDCAVLNSFISCEEHKRALKKKMESEIAEHQMKQESIGFEIRRHLSARAPSSDELDAAYTPLLVERDAFTSPTTRAASGDTDGAEPVPGAPATETIAAQSASTAAQADRALAKLRLEYKTIEIKIESSISQYDLELIKLKSSAPYSALRDARSARDVTNRMYACSMDSLYEHLSSTLGVTELPKLLVSAGLGAEASSSLRPCDQARAMWTWIVRSTSRTDQGYFNARMREHSPFDYEPLPHTPLQSAFAELAAREQHFERLGNTITWATKLSLRMRLVQTDDQTRLVLQLFEQHHTKDVTADTLRQFELQLSNYSGLKAASFRSQPTLRDHEQRGSTQAKQSAAARIAQQHARGPYSPHARTHRPHSPTSPDSPDRRDAVRDDLCRKHGGQHSFRDCPDRANFNGKTVVKFNDQGKGVNNARSSKATAILNAPRKAGSFAILGDLDEENVPLSAKTLQPSAFKTASSLQYTPKKAHIHSAKGSANRIFACADSGASLHIVDEKLITENRRRFVDGSVVWGDGSSIKTVVSGTVNATLIGKDGFEQQISFPAWGVPQLATPLLSATAFARGGAALHVEKNNSYLDFRKLGGKRLTIADDCMVRFNLTASKPTVLAKANVASTASRKPNRRRASRLPVAQGN